MSYKLRGSISAHSQDVKAVVTMDSAIISGSRDGVAKMWMENGNTKYELASSLTGHTNYVSAVTVLPSSDIYPCGLIVTGSHDHKINTYLPYTIEPNSVMTGHCEAVVWLYPSQRARYVLSSSWDKTARVWDTTTGEQVVVLSGHTEGVWCVIDIPEGYIVTASGDKTIKVFFLDGSFVNTITGHDDCVRGLAYVADGIIMSCSNDGTVRKWLVRTGECLENVKVHTNYVYGIFTNPGKNIFAFGGENHILSIWDKKSDIKDRQVIYLPATAVWSVAFLPNSDVVTGSSDGYIRIFTKDPSRYASLQEIQAYEQEVIVHRLKHTTSGLPGIEALERNGVVDGEALLLHHEGKNHCYLWNKTDEVWEHYMDAVCPSADENRPKEEYNGQLYDFVFNVDLGGGGSYLKLPFNKTDNPTEVAQKFIIQNGLNPDFLDRIILFISESAGLTKPADTPSTSKAKPVIVYESRVYYPTRCYVFFEQFDFKNIAKKIEEYMLLMEKEKETINMVKESLKTLLDSSANSDSFEHNFCVLLEAIRDWPDEYLFPILDVTRMACRKKELHELLFSSTNARRLFLSLERFFFNNSSANNKMFIFRILSNMFTASPGKTYIFENKDILFPKLLGIANENVSSHKGLQVAVGTFLVNFSRAAMKRGDDKAAKLCLDLTKNVIHFVSDTEAMFRTLVALGNLSIIEGIGLITEDLLMVLGSVAGWDRDDPIKQKASICADFILHDVAPGYIAQ